MAPERSSPELVLFESLRAHLYDACAAVGDYVQAENKDPLALPLAVSVACNVLLLSFVFCFSRRALPAGAARPHANGSSHTAGAAPGAQYSGKRSAKKKRDPPVISSLVGAVADLKVLAQEDKYLEAGDLLDALRKELALANSGSGSWGGWGGAADAQQQLDSFLKDGTLEERIRTNRGAVQDLNSDEGFELVKQEERLKVMQRLTPDRHLTVKIEAQLEGVRADQCMMIWREAALYPDWMPFITGGQTLKENGPADVILHLLVETFFMTVDMVLWGKLCDNMSEGQFLACVRPIHASTKLPPGVSIPPVGEGSTRSTLFGTMRADAVIDILVEPLEDGSVRFAFQMSDTLPPFMPSWAINYVVQHAMVHIFDKMREVAVGMATKDPDSMHLAFVNRREYQPTKEWISARLPS